jgi:hypothetical protein
LIQDLGTGDWQLIAEKMPGRNIRQCKERWLNYLSPDIRNGAWTVAEDQLLLSKVQECGFVWKAIASCFGARTDISLKSRWHLLQRHIRREIQSYPPPQQSQIRENESIPETTLVKVASSDQLQDSGWDTWTFGDEIANEFCSQNYD